MELIKDMPMLKILNSIEATSNYSIIKIVILVKFSFTCSSDVSRLRCIWSMAEIIIGWTSSMDKELT